MSFRVQRQVFSICCRVAWYAESRTSFTDIGLQLMLALSPKTTRHAYARWIVDALVDHQDALSMVPCSSTVKSS